MKFQPDDNELKEEDEIVIDEPSPKRPSKQELCHTIDLLLTFSLIVEVDINLLFQIQC